MRFFGKKEWRLIFNTSTTIHSGWISKLRSARCARWRKDEESMHQTRNGQRINKAFLWRVVADVVFVNASLSGALIIRYLLKVSGVPGVANIHELNRAFLSLYYT